MDAQAATTERGTLVIPELALVVLIGASGAGKSTFAAQHFKPTEVLSSDHYRAVVSDDPNDLTASADAFAALHAILGLRLARGKLTVVDATNVKAQDRAHLVRIAREHDVLPVAIVLDVDESTCIAHDAARPDRHVGAQVVRTHRRNLKQGIGRGTRTLEREGFRYVYVLDALAAIDSARIQRVPLWSDRRGEAGPFDIIGDVHGCLDELEELLDRLGYQPDDEAGRHHPAGRRTVFLGDLVDRGPRVVETVRLVERMVRGGAALCLPGNHDMKLVRHLAGRQVQVSHGLGESIAQIEALPADERAEWAAAYRAFMEGLVAHLVLDGGRLVVAHAGMKQAYQGRASGRVRAFALFGETTGETDAFGLPVRTNWAADYRGPAAVVYGHTPVPEPSWLNNTINVDTGCVFGGQLTALRWPERELVSVPARRVYAEPARPLARPTSTESGIPDAASPETPPDTLLRIEDVLGKQIIATRLAGNVIAEEDRGAAALEVLSRFALDPRWLIYLPPTMSPCETANEPGWLEYPSEAFSYYRANGVPRVVCEEKHMGSRAVLVVCRDDATARRRFGVGGGPNPLPPSLGGKGPQAEDGGAGARPPSLSGSDAVGACYTRTGRRFFDDDATDRELIARVAAALTASGAWERYATDWIALDAEILPWSAKAQGLLREQYAPVAAAGMTSLAAALAAAEHATARGVAVDDLLGRLRGREADLQKYQTAYRRYCWNVQGLDGVRVAPFQLLATEGRTYFERDHRWHMSELARLAEADPLFLATEHRVVDVLDPESCAAAADWWLALTERGGEGMVVKPFDGIARGPRGLVQPAVKVRGREYLRIIYGPEYTEADQMARLRRRGLSTKRTLALREFALGVEALERFTRREPLWRVHQAVFGVLALESEPVDPRL